MTVKVSSGLAWLAVSDLRGVVSPLTSDVDLAIETADALQERIDTVVIGLDKTRRTGYISVVKGLLGGGATAPMRDANYFELVLAEIRVRAATPVILASDISDQRADESVCGLVRDGVQSIPSATFQAQAEAIILEMRDAIADALADAGIIDNLTTADAYKALSANMGKKLQDEKAPKANPTFTGLAQFGNIQVSTVTAQTEVYAAKLSSPSLVGMVAFFAGTVNTVGLLKCDGTAVSRSTYATLFNFIGTAYGAGDGGTTFNLPNLCDGSFIRGVGGNAAAIGAKQQDAVKAHTHGVPPIIAVAQDTPDASGYAKFANSQSGATSGQTPAGEVETRPLNTAMTPYIKY
jgi:microcystin-dependent protein